MPKGKRLDRDGQPISRRFGAARLSDRALDELIGVCRGVAFDGAISLSEAEALKAWIDCNRDHAHQWPANLLYARLAEMLVDRVLDQEEERELLQLLRDIVGGS